MCKILLLLFYISTVFVNSNGVNDLGAFFFLISGIFANAYNKKKSGVTNESSFSFRAGFGDFQGRKIVDRNE